MLRHWSRRTLADLLAERGLEGLPEEPFPNDGWSGARLTQLRRGTERFVLKRTSWATDWIARATRDRAIREAFVADGVILPAPAWSPYLGAAADGTSAVVLMPDLSAELLAWERPVHDPPLAPEDLDRVLDAVAALHVGTWSLPPSRAGRFPWCPLRERLELLGRPAAQRYRAAGLTVGQRFLAGWAAFDRFAPAGARELVDRLSADARPLVDALAKLPAVRLHGDLKLANVALLPDRRVGFIDWQLTCRAPVAVELGWLLVSNVSAVPLGPEAVLDRYLRALERTVPPVGPPEERITDVAGNVGAVIGDWDRQVGLTWVVGLVLRGWRKGLDAEAGVMLPTGASAAADLAWWSTRAVDAADRWLE